MLMAQDINITASMAHEAGQVEQGTAVFDTRTSRTNTECNHATLSPSHDSTSEDLPGYQSRAQSDAERSGPVDWPGWKKAAVVIALTAVTFSTAVSPMTIGDSGVHNTSEPIGASHSPPQVGPSTFGLRNAAKLGMALYFIALAFGQMLLAPLSEVIGRCPVLLLSSMTHLAVSVVLLYLHNAVAVTAARALQGLCASGSFAITLGVLTDTFKPLHRHAAFQSQLFVVFFAQAATPVYSAWLSDVAPPHFVLTSHVLLTAVTTLILAAFIFETRAPVESLRDPSQRKRLAKRIRYNLKSSACMLVTDPVVLIIAAWLAMSQIVISLAVSTLPYFVGHVGIDGSVQILVKYDVLRACDAAALLGACLAIPLHVIFRLVNRCVGGRSKQVFTSRVGRENDGRSATCDAQNDDPQEDASDGCSNRFQRPELVLLSAIIGSCTIATGCVLVFFASRAPSIQLLAPIATGALAMGWYLCQLGCYLYISITYEVFTSSALAAALVFKYIFGAVTPSTGEYLCSRFGTFGVILAVVIASIAVLALPLLLIAKGNAIRKRSRMACEADLACRMNAAMAGRMACPDFTDGVHIHTQEEVHSVRLPKYDEAIVTPAMPPAVHKSV